MWQWTVTSRCGSPPLHRSTHAARFSRWQSVLRCPCPFPVRCTQCTPPAPAPALQSRPLRMPPNAAGHARHGPAAQIPAFPRSCPLSAGAPRATRVGPCPRPRRCPHCPGIGAVLWPRARALQSSGCSYVDLASDSPVILCSGARRGAQLNKSSNQQRNITLGKPGSANPRTHPLPSRPSWPKIVPHGPDLWATPSQCGDSETAGVM